MAEPTISDLLVMEQDYAAYLKEDRDYLVVLVRALVSQGLSVAPGGLVDSQGISVYAEALTYLARKGMFVIQSEVGRMVVGWWPEDIPDDVRARVPNHAKLSVVDLVRALNKLDLRWS